MFALFCVYCLIGAFALQFYGSNKTDTTLGDWIATIAAVLLWPAIVLFIIYKIFYSRRIP